MNTDLSRRSSQIVELRQYSLVPEKRETLIDLFERELIEPQELLGMRILGQFRDLDDPDRFVWLRGFDTMETRHAGLASFYGGPVWHAHRNAANATMVDSDNVLLLRPARADSAFLPGKRPEGERGDSKDGFVIAAIVTFDDPHAAAVAVDVFESQVTPALARIPASVLGYFVSEESENTFPLLPVRNDGYFFVWFSGVSGRDEMNRVRDVAQREWFRGIPSGPVRHEVLRLDPAARSLLTGGTASGEAARST